MNPQSNLFFILGCQRTGTTLLRLIMESHSKIDCIDEPDSYASLELFKPSDCLQCFKIPLFTEQMNEDFFSDPSLDFVVPNVFSAPKMLFSIRDVRDTICSMINLKQGDSSWFNLWPTKTISFWKATIPNFEKKYEDDLETISRSNEKLFASASFYWKIKTQSYLEYRKTNLPVCGIKYEELVSEPKTTIEQILKFLNLEWENSLLSHHTLKHSQTDEHGMTVGNTNTQKPIFDTSVGKYNDVLSSDQQDVILDISGPLMKELGYEL